MIKTESGYVSGFETEDGAVSVFRGIPYAASPEGRLRWKAPEAAPSWEGVRECTHFGGNAIQPPQSPFYMWTEEFIIDTSAGYSEDCLTLNIYCPSDTDKKDRPVIVYFHGGSFISGGASCEIYDGRQLAKRGVIFVTIDFRLGILGLLASSGLSAQNPGKISGNFQLLDQIAALKWIRRNIPSFGGDPDNITIMGQSSGAASISTLAVSPLARNLFKRVFAMSYDLLNMPVSAVPDATGNLAFRDIFKPLAECEREGDAVCTGGPGHMRSMDPDQLLALPAFYPYCIDGHVLTGTFSEGVRAGLTDEYDFMLTYTANDSRLFLFMHNVTGAEDYEPAMRRFFGRHADRAMELYPFRGDAMEFKFRISDDRYTASTLMFARLRKNARTWLARFDHVMPGPEAQIYGAFHSSDVPYWLGYFSDKRKSFWRSEDRALGEELLTRLAAFARTGIPEGNTAASWKPSDGSSLFRIDAEDRQQICPLEEEKYQFWRDVYCVN